MTTTPLQQQVAETQRQLERAKERASQLKEVIDHHETVVNEYRALVGSVWDKCSGAIPSLTENLKRLHHLVELQSKPNAVHTDGSLIPNLYVTRVTACRIYTEKVVNSDRTHAGYYQLGSRNYTGIDFTATKEAYTAWLKNSTDV